MKALATLLLALCVVSSAPGLASANETTPVKVITDLNIRQIEVPLNTVVMFCFTNSSRRVFWSVDEWSNGAADYWGTDVRYDSTDSTGRFRDCPETAMTAIEFRTFKAGRSRIVFRHADYDVPVGALIPMTAVEVEIIAQP